MRVSLNITSIFLKIAKNKESFALKSIPQADPQDPIEKPGAVVLSLKRAQNESAGQYVCPVQAQNHDPLAHRIQDETVIDAEFEDFAGEKNRLQGKRERNLYNTNEYDQQKGGVINFYV